MVGCACLLFSRWCLRRFAARHMSSLRDNLHEGIVLRSLHHEKKSGLENTESGVGVGGGTSELAEKHSRMQRIKFGMRLCKRVSFKSVWTQI